MEGVERVRGRRGSEGEEGAGEERGRGGRGRREGRREDARGGGKQSKVVGQAPPHPSSAFVVTRHLGRPLGAAEMPLRCY